MLDVSTICMLEVSKFPDFSRCAVAVWQWQQCQCVSPGHRLVLVLAVQWQVVALSSSVAGLVSMT